MNSEWGVTPPLVGRKLSSINLFSQYDFRIKRDPLFLVFRNSLPQVIEQSLFLVPCSVHRIPFADGREENPAITAPPTAEEGKRPPLVLSHFDFFIHLELAKSKQGGRGSGGDR